MGKATRIKAPRDTLLETAIASGLPVAQRDGASLVLADATIEDGHSRSASHTVRRLTRVELLVRAGVLEPHEAQACEWYAEIAALAWDTTGCTANYEGGRGGGGNAHAPDKLMAKYQAIADARDDYREARGMLAGTLGDAFEAIVLRNDALGPTAAAAFPDLRRSQAGQRLRTTVKFCANKLHERYGKQMGWLDQTLAAPAPKAAPASGPAPALVKTQPSQAPHLADSIAAAVRIARLMGQDPDQIWIARPCYRALARELGMEPTAVNDVLIVIREEWRWGYVAIASAEAAIAA